MQIGELLYRLRMTQGASQDMLAQALGVSSSYLSLIERGKRPATIQVMRRVANWLGIAVGLLVLQSMEPGALEPQARALVKNIQREFEKALSSGDFACLQHRLSN